MNDYAAAGCQSGGSGCASVYAASVPGVVPSRFITWYQAVAVARNAGKRLATNVEWQAAATGSPAGAPCIASGAPGLTGTAGCVSDAGAFDMTGNVSELTADSVPTASQVGPAACSLPPFCIMERDGPGAAAGSPGAASSASTIGFRGAR